MSNNIKFTTCNFRTKKGVEILKGEKVALTFNVKAKGKDEILPHYVRMTADDGRTIITKNFAGVGIRRPSMQKLEYWSMDSVCKSVFGYEIEPDGWDHYGSPSWLLALGFI